PCGGITGNTDKVLGLAVSAHGSLVDGHRWAANAGADNADDCAAAQREGWTDLYGSGGNRICDRASTCHSSAAPQSANTVCRTAGLADEQQPVRRDAYRVSVGSVMARRFPGGCVSAGGAISSQTRRSLNPAGFLLGSLVFEVQRDLQDFIRQEVGVHVVHIGQDHHARTAVARDQEGCVRTLLSASVARGSKAKLFGDEPSQ